MTWLTIQLFFLSFWGNRTNIDIGRGIGHLLREPRRRLDYVSSTTCSGMCVTLFPQLNSTGTRHRASIFSLTFHSVSFKLQTVFGKLKKFHYSAIKNIFSNQLLTNQRTRFSVNFHTHYLFYNTNLHNRKMIRKKKLKKKDKSLILFDEFQRGLFSIFFLMFFNDLLVNWPMNLHFKYHNHIQESRISGEPV